MTAPWSAGPGWAPPTSVQGCRSSDGTPSPTRGRQEPASVHVLLSPPPEPAGRVPGNPGSGGRRRQGAGQPPIRTLGTELLWKRGTCLRK